MIKKHKLKQIKIRIMVILCMLGMAAFVFIYVKDLKEEMDTPIEQASPPSYQKVHLSAVGDILMEEGIYDWLGDDFDFKDYFLDVKTLLQGDIMFMNQETVVGGDDLGIRKDNYVFNTSSKVADQLRNLGFNMVSIANNHCLDMGETGFENTLDYWRQFSNLVYAGMYDSKEDRETVRVIERNNIKFGFLAYTRFTNKKWLEDDELYKVSYSQELYTENFTEQHKQMMKEEIERVKKSSDVVVVSIHWGVEGSFEVDDTQKKIAAWLNECGVDIILGHHPHIIQPCEWLVNPTNGNKTFVAYSLGNFISSDPDIDLNTDEGSAYTLSSILSMDILKKENKVSIENVVFTPLVNHFEADDTQYHLYPLWAYNDVLARKHARNYYNDEVFDCEWIEKIVTEVMENGAVKIRLKQFYHPIKW